MNRNYLIFGLIALIIIVSAQVTHSQEEDMCNNMQGLIEAGNDAAIIVQASIDLGMEACEAVKCAYTSDAKLALIIHGAFAAEVSSDIVTSCLIEAGAEIKSIENIYARRNAMGTNYSPYEALPVPSEITGVPGSPGIGSGSDNASGIVSPNTF